MDVVRKMQADWGVKDQAGLTLFEMAAATSEPIFHALLETDNIDLTNFKSSPGSILAFVVMSTIKTHFSYDAQSISQEELAFEFQRIMAKVPKEGQSEYLKSARELLLWMLKPLLAMSQPDDCKPEQTQLAYITQIVMSAFSLGD